MNVLVKQYFRNLVDGIPLSDMSAGALAGYYLYVYPGNPEDAILSDIDAMNIPAILGQGALALIRAVKLDS